jgi:hypothetical protein
MGFVVNKLALGLVFLQVLCFPLSVSFLHDSLEESPQFDHPKTLKAMLPFIKLFVLTGLSPLCFVFHSA